MSDKVGVIVRAYESFGPALPFPFLSRILSFTMNRFPHLEPLGYSADFDSHIDEHLVESRLLARVSEEHRTSYVVRTDRFEIPAEVAGKMMFTAESRKDFPAVGDWVAASSHDDDSHAIIHSILPRKTMLMRKAIGKRLEEQIIATNVDYVFAIQGMDETFNPRRLERLLVLARESGAIPVALLSKRDLCPPGFIPQVLDSAHQAAGDALVLSYAIDNADDIKAVREFIKPGCTFCLVGPSGAGKSSLINVLAGREILATGEVRVYDAKGRHTTTHRELIVLAQGGILIDTPGLRELGVWDNAAAIELTFDDVIELAGECHYTDCTHTHEPGCSVKQALEDGTLEPERYEGYVKLLREQHALDARKTIQGALKKKQHD